MAEAKATASTFSLDSFNKSIDDIQSAYDTLTKAKDEWNKNGTYSLDTVQALLALEPKYLAMLVNENGQLKLNEQAMYDLVNAQLEEAKSKIYQNGINQLNRADFSQNLRRTDGAVPALVLDRNGLHCHIGSHLKRLGITVASAERRRWLLPVQGIVNAGS